MPIARARVSFLRRLRHPSCIVNFFVSNGFAPAGIPVNLRLPARPYHPAVARRAKCYECGQDAPITRPLYAKQSLLENGDLWLAIATYEAHPRRPTDTRSCSAVSKSVP